MQWLWQLAVVLMVVGSVKPVCARPNVLVFFTDDQRASTICALGNPQWYGSAEARVIADSVIQYQSPQGGWPKSTDLATPPRTPDDIPPPGRGRANSLDNEATTLPMAFLARVVHATEEATYRESFLRGVDYLHAAQFNL